MLLNATGAENVLLLADYAAVKKVIFAPGAPNRKAYTPDGALHFKRGQGTEGSEHSSQRRPHGLLAGQDLRELVRGLEDEKQRTAAAAAEAVASEAAAKQAEAAAQKKLAALSQYCAAAAKVSRDAERARREHAAEAEAGSHEHGVQQAREDVEAAKEEVKRVAREAEEARSRRPAAPPPRRPAATSRGRRLQPSGVENPMGAGRRLQPHGRGGCSRISVCVGGGATRCAAGCNPVHTGCSPTRVPTHAGRGEAAAGVRWSAAATAQAGRGRGGAARVGRQGCCGVRAGRRRGRQAQGGGG